MIAHCSAIHPTRSRTTGTGSMTYFWRANWDSRFSNFQAVLRTKPDVGLPYIPLMNVLDDLRQRLNGVTWRQWCWLSSAHKWWPIAGNRQWILQCRRWIISDPGLTLVAHCNVLSHSIEITVGYLQIEIEKMDAFLVRLLWRECQKSGV